jgi:hypothetical protein
MAQQIPLNQLTPQALSALGAYPPVQPHPGYHLHPANELEWLTNHVLEVKTELQNESIRRANRQIGKGGPSGISNCRLVPIRRKDGATPPRHLAFTKVQHLERFSAQDIADYAQFYDLRHNVWLKWQTAATTPMSVHRAKILVFMGARKHVSGKTIPV